MDGPHCLVVTFRKGLNGHGLCGLDESVWQLAAVRLCVTLPEKMLNIQWLKKLFQCLAVLER